MEITMIIRVMTTKIIAVITQDAHSDPVMITTTTTTITITIMQIMKNVIVKSC